MQSPNSTINTPTSPESQNHHTPALFHKQKMAIKVALSAALLVALLALAGATSFTTTVTTTSLEDSRESYQERQCRQDRQSFTFLYCIYFSPSYFLILAPPLLQAAAAGTPTARMPKLPDPAWPIRGGCRNGDEKPAATTIHPRMLPEPEGDWAATIGVRVRSRETRPATGAAVRAGGVERAGVSEGSDAAQSLQLEDTAMPDQGYLCLDTYRPF